jgi:hypothetical protein
MDPKKKNDKKTTIYVIGGLVVLLSATAFFVFRTPKSQAYRETRVVSMEAESTHTPTPTKEPIQVEEDEEFVEPNTQVADTAYMTVTVPGFSTEDLKKKKEEDKDKEKTKTTNTTKTTKTVTTTQTTGQPAIVDHYYVDDTGKQVDNPDKSSDTVYVIEYDKSKQPTSNEFQDVISDYLKGDTTYVADNAKVAAALNDNSMTVTGSGNGTTGTNTGTKTNNSGSSGLSDDSLIVTGDSVTTNQSNQSNQNFESTDDTMIVKQGDDINAEEESVESTGEGSEEDEDDPIDKEDKVDEEEKDIIMELEGDGVTDEERPSVVRVAENGFEIDPVTQEQDRYGIQLTWNLNNINDGKLILSPYGLPTNYIKSVDWQCRIVEGSGYIQDTEDDFVKLVHVEDGSAIDVVASAVFVDDSIKTSSIVTVAHKDYSPLNSNQVTMVEE